MATRKDPTKPKHSTRTLERHFARAPEVDPRPITGKERPLDLLEHAFPAFVGRQVRDAYRLMERSMAEDHAIFLTLSGAMTPAGFHQSVIIPLIERGVVSCLTTTGANLYHDAHRVIGHRIREVDPEGGDLAYRLARVIRIYDLGFVEETLLDTDRLFSAILMRPEFQRKMTTPELHFLLGKALHEVEKVLGVERPSLLSTCYAKRVPIFVGAVQDGSIFLNVVKLRQLYPDDFKLEIDLAEDVFEMAALQHHVRQTASGKAAVWIFGGGVPKNYTLQGEPTLDQILQVPARGFDIDLQFCVDPVDNGALSSCPAGEGHTWGKVSADAVARGSQYVHCDMTAVVPFLVSALFSSKQGRRKPRRLYDQRGEALETLRKAVRRRRRALEESASHPAIP
ncbi:MAG: deoxyhypusine synthase family protein [Deltaproteobacteria bacterium]|nr:deoxyhypusine synthase family protein [Deltaproteobacteria bacterium]